MNVSFLVYLDAHNKENIDLPPKKRCFARSEVIKWSKKVTQDMMIGVRWSYTKHIHYPFHHYLRKAVSSNMPTKVTPMHCGWM